MRHKQSGRADCFYFRGVRLRTKDANLARTRARLVLEGKWPPPEQEAAAVTAAAFAITEPPPAPPPEPPPAPPPPPEPPPAPGDPPVTGDWTHAASSAATDGPEPSKEPPRARPMSTDELADVLVNLELQAAEFYVQYRVYEPFVAPPIAPQGRAMLAGAYKTILDYGGAALELPPWVTGVVLPLITVVGSTMAIVAGFKDAAQLQKRTAESGG